MKTKSIATSNGIKIDVFSEYLQKESMPEFKKYLFSYRIMIKNEGSEWAKLISRYWLIINADGDSEEVKGPGVVGYTPELKPGDTFTYTSFCPLDTAWGTMEGYYSFIRRDGSEFKSEIDRFYLVSPNTD